LNTKTFTDFFFHSLVHSYSQVFFSKNRVFGIILILVSFIDFYCGLAGLFAVIVANALAYRMGFNKYNIREGYYGFNVLLVGLGLGIYFHTDLNFYILLFFLSILTLFITLAMEGVIGKYALPYLSIPFLIAIWLVTLATRQFESLIISERGIYIFSTLYDKGNMTFVHIYEYFNSLNIHESVLLYFKSLGAIFFQYNILAGILVSIGILIFSRISFILSLLGFYVAYFFYHIFGGDLTQLSYAYIGFNFILSSIALGGLYLIASKSSFFWVLVLIPLLVVVSAGSYGVFELFQLPVYSLPFNIVVLLFLYILKFRIHTKKQPQIVAIQHFSPEKNLYAQLNFNERFSNATYVNIVLPVYGQWKTTQAHDGDITHKEEWRHAWDFEIENENGETFKNAGQSVKDYYCYDKPILAPADGHVVEVMNSVPDNRIGDMNLKYNWGNTIVIQHAEHLFSQLSHLKMDSIKVKPGDLVKRGDLLAATGNSGRSPVPHLHFQLQATPHIGSKTMDHPISYYILTHEDKNEICFYDRPQKGDVISNIMKNSLIAQSFRFIPGRIFKFQMQDEKKKSTKIVEWEIQSDIYNNTYILDKKTLSMAFFSNDGLMHNFYNYKGKRNILLYYFYLAAYRMPMGYYQDLIIKDLYRLDLIPGRFFLFFQDFVAPFFLFRKAIFELQFLKNDSDLSSEEIVLESSTRVKSPGLNKEMFHFEIELRNGSIEIFKIKKRSQSYTATCIE
jgi:urea transporter/murein DD-endopeptidase MepM/ murein hydrolase activator NlpD